MAGHSKWANIQHRKGRQDASRSKLFSKLSREITIATKLGDPDPDKNPRLRLAVREARSNSVPKDVIERAITKATGGDSENLEEVRYEGFGPGGVAVIVETLTDNRNRTASLVRSTFGKLGGNLAETGSVSHMFERVGEIVFALETGDAETVMDAAIEAGADDIETDDDGHTIYTLDTDLATVAQALEDNLGAAVSTRLIWKPSVITELDLEGAQKIIRLIETLEDADEVQRVTANFDIPLDVLTQVG